MAFRCEPWQSLAFKTGVEEREVKSSKLESLWSFQDEGVRNVQGGVSYKGLLIAGVLQFRDGCDEIESGVGRHPVSSLGFFEDNGEE